jgi:hypothetical protein
MKFYAIKGILLFFSFGASTLFAADSSWLDLAGVYTVTSPTCFNFSNVEEVEIMTDAAESALDVVITQIDATDSYPDVGFNIFHFRNINKGKVKFAKNDDDGGRYVGTINTTYKQNTLMSKEKGTYFFLAFIPMGFLSETNKLVQDENSVEKRLILSTESDQYSSSCELIAN